MAALKQNLRVGAGLPLRRALVVFQFAVSVALIAGTLAVYRQLHYMQGQGLGFRGEQVLVVKLPKVVPPGYDGRMKSLRAELLRHPAIQGVTVSSNVPGNGFSWQTHGIYRENESPENSAHYNMFWVDHDFVPFYELPLVAGRNFSPDHSTDHQGILLNEQAVRRLGFASPEEALHQRVVMQEQGAFEVVGVLQDYHHSSLRTAIEPIILLLNPVGYGYLSVRVHPGQLPETVALVEQTYQQLFPRNLFAFHFLDESFDQQYQADRQFGKIFSLFAGLAVFIACLGLFGLASFSSSQRTKEIGVRKVLGASVAQLLVLLTRDFLKLVLLANLLAWPLVWWGVGQWLQNYAFQVGFSPWLLLLPTLLVLLIALLTVSLQTWRAARANPVESLRNE
jgi:putative ABC transport system permease protein